MSALILGLTPSEVSRRVDKIAAFASVNDPESAHTDEDALFLDVLLAVAIGHPDSRELALEAIRSVRLDFPRWAA